MIMMLYIFLSHDFDWRKQRLSKEHILATSNRFENLVLEEIDSENLYYNFSEITDLEERLGVRSTFFPDTL